jgi:GNAT superfamily N-acetyltransferase
MPELDFVPAERLSLSELTALLNGVYADYAVPVQRSTAEIETSQRAWDIDLAASVVVRMDAAPVGVALVARRGSCGWLGSMGVLPPWRRQGIGRRLLQEVQATARRAGLLHLDLEVLTRNTAALALYEAAGFQIQRELLVWERRAEQGALPDPYFKLQAADVSWALAQAPTWHDTPPCWQRQPASLRHLADLHAVAVADASGERRAYLLFRPPQAGRIRLVDVGAAPGHEPRRLGRELLQGFHLRHFGVSVTLVNEPVESAWNRVFVAMGYYVIERQHEMRWHVT